MNFGFSCSECKCGACSDCSQATDNCFNSLYSTVGVLLNGTTLYSGVIYDFPPSTLPHRTMTTCAGLNDVCPYNFASTYDISVQLSDVQGFFVSGCQACKYIVRLRARLSPVGGDSWDYILEGSRSFVDCYDTGGALAFGAWTLIAGGGEHEPDCLDAVLACLTAQTVTGTIDIPTCPCGAP